MNFYNLENEDFIAEMNRLRKTYLLADSKKVGKMCEEIMFDVS